MNKIQEIVIGKLVEKITSGTYKYTHNYQQVLLPPMNIEGGNLYTGVNRIVLHPIMHEYKTPYYLTALQAKENDLFIKKGEHSHSVLFVKYLDKANDTEDEIMLDDNKRRIIRYYNVFNIDQLDGKKIESYMQRNKEIIEKILGGKRVLGENNVIEGIKTLLNNKSVEFSETNNLDAPKYRRRMLPESNEILDNKIIMPLREQFHNDTGYIMTFLHELSHYYDIYAYGDIHEFKSRNRDDENYRNKKEIIAECSALFSTINIASALSSSIKLDDTEMESSFAYIKSYQSSLTTTNNKIFEAAIGRSIEISNYICNDIAPLLGIESAQEKQRFKAILHEIDHKKDNFIER